MPIKKIFLLFIFTFSTISFAQNSLKFDFDFAKFNYDSTSVYLEVYYSFNKASLTQIDENGQKKVEAILHITLQDTVSKAYSVNRDWKLVDYIQATDISMQDQTGVLGFVVDQGVYSLEVIGRDVNSPNLDRKVVEIVEIRPYLEPGVRVSDIQLSSRIITDNADPNSIFFKNTLEVIPNPTRIFTNDTPVLFYYAEIYNLLNNKGACKLEKSLYSSTGANYYKKSKNIVVTQNSVVDVGLINLAKYPSDTYTLVLNLIDTTNNTSVVSLKRFYLYNPGVEGENKNKFVSGNFMESEFSVMSDEECDDLFEKSIYICSSDDRERYKNLDSLTAKRDFLFNFWKVRDLIPETPENEYKREYLLRVSYADKHFANRLNSGYKTDMGRVYVLFGPPEEREYFPMTQDYKPYEIWFYHQIEGGASFTFGDITGFGNYELLHSTKRGEVYDSNWMGRLQMMSGSGNSME